MAPQLLSDVWERWAPAIVYFYNQESFPFCDRAEFENHICSELKNGNRIRIDGLGRQFDIDLIETSPDNFDIVAFSVIKFTMRHRLLGGEVITELSAKHPRASDHVEYIRGMQNFRITSSGNIWAFCCQEDWMKDTYVVNRHSDARAVAEASRQKIVKVAKERKLQALKLTQMEPKKELPTMSTEDLGMDEELNHNLFALCKKVATLLASKGERKTIKVSENISTQEALSFMSKAIDDLQHWATSGPFDQTRGDKSPEKAALSKATARAQEEEIKKMKKSHANEKELLKLDVRRLDIGVQLLECDVEELTEEKKQLEKINADLKYDVEHFHSRAKDAEKRFNRLTVQHFVDANRKELTESSAHHVPCQLQEAFRQHSNIEEITHKQVSEEGQHSPHSPSDNEMEDEELVIKHENFDEDSFFKDLTEDLSTMAKEEDGASKQSRKQHRISQLETGLETTTEALKNKTDELTSATEKHANELIEAGGNKEKCRCKDKEAYLESVEEHVEKLRGTMEDVLRHVSTYQGRKRRRTEGLDFEY